MDPHLVIRLIVNDCVIVMQPLGELGTPGTRWTVVLSHSPFSLDRSACMSHAMSHLCAPFAYSACCRLSCL